MRRIAALMTVATAVLALSLVVPPTASAAGPVVISNPAKIGAISGLTEYDQVPSDDTSKPTGSFSMVSGPGQVPLGSGSLRVGLGFNPKTGVALFDQSFLNFYFNAGTNEALMFPVVYQPGALVLSFGYFLSASDVPVKVEITVWHGSGPVVYQAALSGSGWQSFDLSTAMLVDSANPTGPAKTLAEWVVPGDSLFAVFLGIDDGTGKANQSFNLDNLQYGFKITQGPAVNTVTTYNFEVPAPTPPPSSHPRTPPHGSGPGGGPADPQPGGPNPLGLAPGGVTGGVTGGGSGPGGFDPGSGTDGVGGASGPVGTAGGPGSRSSDAPGPGADPVAAGAPSTTARAGATPQQQAVAKTKQNGSMWLAVRIALIAVGLVLILVSRRRVVAG